MAIEDYMTVAEPTDELIETDAVVVGDTHFDILMGRNAGCTTVGVTYGNGTRESLKEAGADIIVDSFAEI